MLDVIDRDVRRRYERARILYPPEGQAMLVWELDREAIESHGCDIDQTRISPEIVSTYGSVVVEIPWEVVGHRPSAIFHLDTGEVEYPPPRNTGGES